MKFNMFLYSVEKKKQFDFPIVKDFDYCASVPILINILYIPILIIQNTIFYN